MSNQQAFNEVQRLDWYLKYYREINSPKKVKLILDKIEKLYPQAKEFAAKDDFMMMVLGSQLCKHSEGI